MNTGPVLSVHELKKSIDTGTHRVDILRGIDFARSALLTSGRIAADMALKARAAGIPVLATRSIPTTSAYALALEAGITIVGRIGAERPVVYTLPERIR
mgnify:CR=1 FL=1